MVASMDDKTTGHVLGISRSPRSTWIWSGSTAQRDAVREVLAAADCPWWPAKRYGGFVDLATDVGIGWDALTATEALEAAGYTFVAYDQNGEPADF